MNSLRLRFDDDFNPIEPTAILATRNGTKIGVIHKNDFLFKGNLSSADELSFTVYKNNVTKDIWNGLKDFQLCWLREWDAYFEITVDVENTDSVVKKITGVSLGEAELSQTNLYGVEINTEAEITNSDTNYIPTVFYNDDDEAHSLMHRMLKKTSYKIGHVDECLCKEQRSFSFDDISIKDGFDNVAKEIKCLFIYRNNTKDGKINRVVDAYNLDDERKDNNGDPVPVYGRDTGIFISDENIAKSITLTTNTGNVKNCFKLEGGDDAMTAAIASCNPTGTAYLWYISDELREVMSDGLRTKLDEYDEKYHEIADNRIYIVDGNFIKQKTCTVYGIVLDDIAGEKYDASKRYEVGDKVNRDGTAYKCKSAVSGGEEWNDDKWEYVYGEHNAIFTDAHKTVIPDYDFAGTTRYTKGDLVQFCIQLAGSVFWKVNVYECIRDFCYSDISGTKPANHPDNFTDYWTERSDKEFTVIFGVNDDKRAIDAYAENIAELSEFLYDAIDVRLFITDAMMPDYNIEELNQDYADSCVDNLEDWFENVNNYIGVKEEEFDNLTDDMVKRAAEGMIKTIIDSRFSVEVSMADSDPSDFVTSKTYEAEVKLTGVNKEGKTVSSEGTLAIKVNHDYANFIKQKVDKALLKKTEKPEKEALDELTTYRGVYTAGENYAKDDIVWYDQKGMYICTAVNGIGVAGNGENDMPDKDTTNWRFLDAKIRFYSIAELQNLYDCCDGCLAALIEQGADGSAFGTENDEMTRNSFYGKYHAVMQALLAQKEYREGQVRLVNLYIYFLRQTIDDIHAELNMESFLGDDNMEELLCYRRESTYRNDNFISDGLTNHELMKRAALFFDDATKEIYKSAERQHSISSSIYNLLVIKEFENVRDQFALGNWLREKLDGVVYTLRLVGYDLNFSDLTTMNVEFSDLIRVGDSVTDVKSILDKAKSVASTYGFTTRQADRGNTANNELSMINKNGVDVGDISVFGNDKSIQWTQGGFILREYDELTDSYSPNQMKFLATGIYATDDNWKTLRKII